MRVHESSIGCASAGVFNSVNAGNNTNNRKIIDPKVLTIIAIVPGENVSNYFKLNNGIYNGQIKKIALHPMWDGNNVDILVPSFCDADGNQNQDARLILNKGGQTLNLLYINNSNLNDGYWMLLDNNFDFI